MNVRSVPTGDFGVTRERPESPPPAPPTRTNAIIADAIERAVRGLDIAKATRIRGINVMPTYATGFDGALLHARVKVELTLFFDTPEAS